MKVRILILHVMMFSFLLSCGVAKSDFGDNIVRNAVDAPSAFTTLSGTTLDEDSCRSPLVDPQDNSELFMRRSSGQQADYEVPIGKYGVQRGELLRIDCSTGEVIGIVKK